MINKNIVCNVLDELGLNSHDVVMIHGNAGVAAQLQSQLFNNNINEFIEILVSFFSNGTLLVPAFSYSATKNEIYDPLTTISEVGLFSESFRKFPTTRRSLHPIFSFSIVGNKTDFFLDSKIDDCFGEGTIFEKFHKSNGKILFIGSSIDRATFVHYVEQQLKVPYRYYKYFNSNINYDNYIKNINIKYFVRDLSIDSVTDLTLFKTMAINEKLLLSSNLGRFPVSCISAFDFYRISKNLYDTNTYSLIRHRLNNG